MIGFVLSSVFATGSGLYLLDIIDNFINNYGIVVVGMFEVILIGWIVKPNTIRDHVNKISYFRIGKWWNITIKFLTPALLIFMLVQSFINEIKTPYGGYPITAIFAYGWSIVALGIIVSLIITKKPWRNKSMDESVESEEAQGVMIGAEVE